MLERIQKHVTERNAIVEELKGIMLYADTESSFEIDLDSKWTLRNDSLHLEVKGDDIEDNCYAYTVSSTGASGKDLFSGEKDGITFVMAYLEDGDYYDTSIFILSNENRIK